MGLPAEKRLFTAEEYFRIELQSPTRHEYHDGQIFEMSGGSYEHSLIISNTNRRLGNALDGKPCRVLDGNLKIGIASMDRFVYPDVFVICGQPQFDPRDPNRHTVTNPRLIVEVLSPSTESYDRTAKFNRYRELDSFEEYVLISQNQAAVETFFRQPDRTWLFTPHSGVEAVVHLRSLTIEPRLADLYAGVEFRSVPESPFDSFAGEH